MPPQDEIINKILGFDEAVRFLKKHNQAIPQVYEFDLSTAKTDLEFTATGNFFYVLDSTNTDDSISVKFNAKDSKGVPLTKQLGLRTPFDRVFITHTAQASKTMTILIGTVSSDFMDVIDNRSNINADIALLLAELQGETTSLNSGSRVAVGTSSVTALASNASRKGCIIHAPYSNTGVIYLRNASTASATNYFIELQAGDSYTVDDYRGIITAISDVVSQNVQVSEW